MNTTTTTEPRELATGMVAVVLEALDNGTPEARKLGHELAKGRQAIAWTCPELPWVALRSPAAMQRLHVLTDALGAQAWAYAADGLTISAGDCHWLVAKLTGGALQVASADRIAAAADQSTCGRFDGYPVF